jgi:hypothetical protein
MKVSVIFVFLSTFRHFEYRKFGFHFRKEALSKMNETLAASNDRWLSFANETYIKEAGWYFKTLAVQEIGEFRFLTSINLFSLHAYLRH